jgi:3-oxoacyl-[acyl-carrier protein] reductase
MSTALAGKFALVTGASRGIGAAIAKKLAAEGASVLVHYANSPDRAKAVAAEIQAAGGEADIAQADLSAADGAAQLVAQLDSAFGGKYAGKLDILVNNAGTGGFATLLDATEEQYDAMYNLNVRSLFQLSKAAAQRMVPAGSGRIINIGSTLGESVPGAGMALYCSTKFAVRGLTKGWARDMGALGATGVTVNAVQPGSTDTDLNPADGPHAGDQIARTPVGRYAAPVEIADAVVFLALPTSGFISGECLTVDGGSGV